MKRFAFLSLILALMLSVSISAGAVELNAPVQPQTTLESADTVTSVPVKAPYIERATEYDINLISIPGSETLVVSQEVSDREVKTTIDVPNATPYTSVVIPFEFKNGESLSLMRDDHGFSNGSALILDKDGIVTGYVLLSGSTAGYVTNGNEIHVLSSGASIMATSVSSNFYDYFYADSNWGVTGEGYIKLALRHKTYLFNYSSDPGSPYQWEMQAKRSASWGTIERKFGSNAKFQMNPVGLRDQYYCHFDTIGSQKATWNLEPERANVGYPATLLAACNPAYTH